MNPAQLNEIATGYAKAWCSGEPAEVASFYATDAQMVINRGHVLTGRASISGMVKGFCDEFPDLSVHCDGIRGAGNHAVFLWTFEGHHSGTNNYVKIGGWEEWELDENLKIKSSLDWFDNQEYLRQIAEGA
ncbi:MAG TPA: DUF1348 family protein [Rhizomicrobium sp.]|jgi:uncharacterized protein (TIGR02246 family)